MKTPVLSRLLGAAFPWPRLVGASSGLFLGFLLLALTVQIWLGVGAAFSGSQSGSREFLFFSKKLTGLEGFALPEPRFSPGDLETLEAQSFVKDWTQVRRNGFRVWAETDVAGGNYGTELFLESVPDRFLDISPKHWAWKPGDPFVPLVIAREFVNLYNFGFSGSRGLPKVTEETASLVPLILTVWGSGGSEKLPARVVGFSDRINSLLVPPSFMDWAENTVAPGTRTAPERVMVEVRDASDPKLKDFLAAHNWETNADRLHSSSLVLTAQVVLGLLGIFALVMTGLSLVLVQLTLRLFLTVHKEVLQTLHRIGISPRRVLGAILGRAGRPLALATALALMGDVGLAWFLETFWRSMGLDLPLSPWIGCGLALLGAGSLVWARLSVKRFLKTV